MQPLILQVLYTYIWHLQRAIKAGCRDVGLVSEADLTCGEIDKVFLRIKPESQPSLNFVQFMEGLRFCAMIKRASLNEVVQTIVAVGGPIEVRQH
jgi:hypothetical protein